MAGQVPIEKKEVALEWIRKRLARDNFGRDDGYAFCGFVEFYDGTVDTYVWCL